MDNTARIDLLRYLKSEMQNDGTFGYKDSQLNEMSNEQLFHAYMEWEGIGDYADNVISLVKGLGL